MLDNFKTIFELQDGFNTRVVDNWINKSNWNDETKDLWIDKQLTAMMAEAVELLDSTHWKWWKKYNKPEDIQNIHVEIVDMLCFLTSVYFIEGKTSEDFFNDWKVKTSTYPTFHKQLIALSKGIGKYADTQQLVHITKVFHGICKQYDLDDETLFAKYKAKMEINHKRQENGYSDTTKDPNDCRHI